MAVEGNQAGLSRRRDRDRIDIVGTRIARRKSQVISFELIDICQQAADGLPGRREDIKARNVCRDDTAYQGFVVASLVVEIETLAIRAVCCRRSNSGGYRP